MKQFVFSIFAAIFAVALCGCECMGFNPNSVGEALTPGVDATTTVRTWQQTPAGAVPAETEVRNSPAFE